jgi:hypothetical protein
MAETADSKSTELDSIRVLVEEEMANNENQHTVPKFYLKGFGYDPEGKRVFVYDKFRRCANSDSVRKLTARKRFYNLSPGVLDSSSQMHEGDIDFVDRTLQRIETEFGVEIHDWLGMSDKDSISLNQKKRMAFFITIQMYRTPEFRKWLIDGATQFYQGIVDDLMKLNGPEDYPHLCPVVSYDPEMESALHGAFMLHPKMITQSISMLCTRHLWVLGIRQGRHHLYTSDTPVVRQAHKQEPVPVPAGLTCKGDELVSHIVFCCNRPGIASEGTEIAFPLNSERILILRERTFFSSQVQNDGRVVTLSDDEVMRYNTLQVEQCYRQVFCKVRDFDLAATICSQHPEVCSPDRNKPYVISRIAEPVKNLL